MKNILIGSRALDYWLDVGIVKENTDFDIISSKPIEGAEFHDRWLLNNDNFDRFTCDSDTIIFNEKVVHVMDVEGLAIIKRSHLWRTVGFAKHITHYHKYLKPYVDLNSSILKERIKMTQEMYPQQGPNLKLSKGESFNDAVVKVFDHDYLHELFANEDKPMYTRLQKDDHEVFCHEYLWNNLSQEQKVLCVQEEVNVLATERFLVPSNFSYNKKMAYLKALEKVCTTVCKGYFRDFAIENYPEVISVYNADKIINVTKELKTLGSPNVLKGQINE